MRKLATLIAAATLLTIGAGVAEAQAKHHRPSCHKGYVHRRVRVHVRSHHKLAWVTRWRCVKSTAKAQAKPQPIGASSAPAKVSYQAKVDPSFTQSKANPLAVTYSYSADATQTVGTVSTDLASTGQLPAGVLNFYSEQSPGGPQSLYCSINVGGSAVGSSCPITYGATGTYQVTTQYIPNAAAATTQTDTEVVSPFTTTTTLSATKGACGSGSPPGYSVPGPYCTYTVANSVADQNGNAVGPQVLLQFAPNTGQSAAGSLVAANRSCTVYVTASWVLSPGSDCNFNAGSGLYDASSWNATAMYGGTNGWAASASSAQTLAPQ